MARKNLQFELNPLLSGPSLHARTVSGSPYRELNVADVDVDPDQPRRVFDDESLAELAASIKEHGLLCPILVRVTAGGTFRVVAGERRLRACRLLGKETIPAIVESEEAITDILSKQLVENLQRQDLNPLERAFAIGRMRDKLKLSFREIATKLGVSKAVVQRSLEILTLPEDLQAALAEGASESKIFVLKEITDATARKPLLDRLEELTREALQGEVEKWRGEKGVYHGGTPKGREKKREASLSTDDRRVVDEMQRSLGTKVHLQRAKAKPERGKLIIEFYNKEDFTEICERLRKGSA